MTESWINIQNKPIKDLRKIDLKYCGSRHIRDDTGLTFYSVTGNQQSGKSSYGMRLLEEIYEGDENEIMRHIVMSAKEFTEIIDKALTGGYRERCIMWDDMSISGSAATWIRDPQLVMYLAALGDTLAIATKSIILTSPSGDMTKAFRSYQKYIVQIGMGRQRHERIARAYFIGRSPMHQRYCSAIFEDWFDTRIPFYERYAEKRKEISIEAVKNMKTMFTDKQEERAISEIIPPNLLLKRKIRKGLSWNDLADDLYDVLGRKVTGEALRIIVDRHSNNNPAPVI